ncbi:hypothetical protein [Stutzerimonas stutzeri]|uniref:hypothetical protein n=1 Tax=Stutzerimonas stutzeri TaxID=316 RepID=UPI0015E34F66|nr:hypothetical protein [Stutzerimonas stutzeri]MBA1264282.1 hypothetical protein [Stutzerimonas stutzeri]
MKLQRPLAWGLSAFVVLAAGFWWAGQSPAPVSPASHVPAGVRPEVSSSATAARTTDIDGLWKRYEALSQAPSSPYAGDIDSQSAPNNSTEPAVSESMRERQVARERIKQRREAMLAARDDALKQIQKLKPGDVNGLVDVLQSFNRRLKENGIEEQIDLKGIRQQLLASQKLAEVNQALLDEALKGAKANPQRLQALSRELSQLQKDITGSFSGRSGDGAESP